MEYSSSVRIALQVVLEPNTQRQVLITATLSGRLAIKRHHRLLRWQHVHAASGIMDVSPDQPSHFWLGTFQPKRYACPSSWKYPILLVLRTSNTQLKETIRKPLQLGDLKIKKNQIELLSCTQPSMTQPCVINPRKVGKRKCRLIKAYKTTVRENRRIIAEKKKNFQTNSPRTMTTLSRCWPIPVNLGQSLGLIIVANHQIELPDDDTQLVHLEPYHAGPRTRKFQKSEIEKMLARHIIKPAQTEWAVPIEFAPEKNETLRYCAHCRKLNAVPEGAFYSIPHMDEPIDFLGKTTVIARRK